MDPEELKERRDLVDRAMNSLEGRVNLGHALASVMETLLSQCMENLTHPDRAEAQDTWVCVGVHPIRISMLELHESSAFDLIDARLDEANDPVVAMMKEHTLPHRGVFGIVSVIQDDPANLIVGWDMLLMFAVDPPLRFVDITEEIR